MKVVELFKEFRDEVQKFKKKQGDVSIETNISDNTLMFLLRGKDQYGMNFSVEQLRDFKSILNSLDIENET
jgi:hypothetical protein